MSPHTTPRKAGRVTWLCRLLLLLLPVWAPIGLVLHIGAAVVDGLTEFGVSLYGRVSRDARDWYRNVYRPARYGSVWDA